MGNDQNQKPGDMSQGTQAVNIGVTQPPQPAQSVPLSTTPVAPPIPVVETLTQQTPSYSMPAPQVSQAPSVQQMTPPVFTPPVAPPVAEPVVPSTTSFTPPPPPPLSTVQSQDFKPEHESKSKLPLIIAGVLLLLAVAGGYFLYMLYQMPSIQAEPPIEMQKPTVSSPTPDVSPTMTIEEKAAKDIEGMKSVSSSDEVTAIEKDVNATDLTTLDADVSVTQ